MTDLTLPIRLDPTSPPDDTLHVTVGGLPVLIYNVNAGGKYPIHGAIFDDGTWIPLSWTASGLRSSAGHASAFDLCDRPKAKRGWWIGAYTKGEQRFAGTFPSKDDALAFDGGDGWRPFGVHYLEEGDGLDTPADPPLWVDWAELPKWAKWAAADESGGAWLYDNRPDLANTVWGVSSVHARCAPLAKHLYRLAPGFKWRETLIQRPEGV